MARTLIRRLLPNLQRLQQYRALRLFGRWLRESSLWYINRRTIAGACAVGLFWAFIPVPTQMLPAAASAIALRVNLPLSVALVWLTNPLTMPPVFYFNYRLGNWLLQLPPRAFEFELSWAWLVNGLGAVWQPFLLGSLAVASSAALLGYFGMRGFWRLQAVRSWDQRNRRRRKPS